jgi:hypothetical protein
VPQIATFAGHGLRDIEAILDAHHPGRNVQIAQSSGAEARSAINSRCQPA